MEDDGMEEEWRARDYTAAMVAGSLIGMILGLITRRKPIDVVSIIRGVHAHRRALSRVVAQQSGSVGPELQQAAGRQEA